MLATNLSRVPSNRRARLGSIVVAVAAVLGAVASLALSLNVSTSGLPRRRKADVAGRLGDRRSAC